MTDRPSEGRILLLLASVHFVNLVDFMMVMPLGPDFALALGIPVSQLGIIGGSYTAAATAAGALAAFVLDRYDRRAALFWSVLGLGLATLGGAVARGYGELVASRVAAGAFGGLAATLCFSIVTDLVPESRRGRATAVVASGFSLSSIVGVPLGLELARLGGWHAPFVAVGGTALALALAARLILPAMRGHLDTGVKGAPLPLDARVGWSFAAFACAILGNFLIVPNLSAYLLINLGFPRERLGLLYMLGGATSLATMRLGGLWTDRAGAARPVLMATLVVSAALVLGTALTPPLIPPILFFVCFMGFNAMRWVSVSAVSTRVPPPSARARYLSAQNAFVHAACAVSAFASTRFLSTDAAGKLVGMPRLAFAAALLGLGVPVATWRLQRLLGDPKPA